MWIILGFILSFSAFSLETFEKLRNVRILKVLPKNIVILNKGLEDGILRNDHAKLSSDISGFNSRALCLKSMNDSSYWKLYRIPDASVFSLYLKYSLIGMADKEIPSEISELRFKRVDFSEEVKEKKKKEEPPLIMPDLPEKLTERDLLDHSSDYKKRKQMIEGGFNREELKKELKKYKLSLYASPFMKQSINHSENLRYGLRGENPGPKYRLITQFEQQQTKLRDPVTKEDVSTRSTNGQVQFVITKPKKSLSSLSLINFNSQYFGNLGTPLRHWQFGPVGLTWNVFMNKEKTLMDFSYIPLYDVRVTEIMENNSIQEKKNTGIRHGIRYGIKSRLSSNVSLENILWARPFHNLSTWYIDVDNLNLLNDFKLMFKVTEKLFFDYNLVYQKDRLWRTISGLPESNTINSLNIRYDLDL